MAASFQIPTAAEFLASAYGQPFGSAPLASVNAALEAAARTTNFDGFALQEDAFQAVFCNAARTLIEMPGAISMREAVSDERRHIWDEQSWRFKVMTTIFKRVF